MFKRQKFLYIVVICLFGMLLIPGRVSLAADLSLQTTKQPDNMLKVKWQYVENATEYRVYISVGDKKHYNQVAAVSTNYCNCTDIDKKKTYYVKIQAINSENQIIAEDTTSFYNGNIVSTSHEKYTYEEMEKDIIQLKDKYADYFHVEIIGVTEDKRNIYDVILGNPEASKCVMFQASIHAREYMTSQLVMEQMEYYLDHYNDKFEKKTYSSIFDKVCVHVVPMSNPDGVTISQKGINGIRSAALRKKIKKMRGSRYTRIWKANARGVDLNQQFNYNFKYIKRLKNGAYAGYGGKKPVSEKETKALVRLVEKCNPEAVVNYHAMGGVIYCNYGGSKKTQKRVYELSGKIRNLTGYYYMGLDRNPGFANWLVCKKNIPSCTVEIGKNTTPVPIRQFKTIWKQNKNVMATVAKLYE